MAWRFVPSCGCFVVDEPGALKGWTAAVGRPRLSVIRGALVVVKIQWQPPVVLEERKRAKWERIIRSALRDVGEPIEVGLSLESDGLRWKVATKAVPDRGEGVPEPSPESVVRALKAAGK